MISCESLHPASVRTPVSLFANPAGSEVPFAKPETFRLPKSGQRDPHFGLSRSGIYELERMGVIRLIRLRKRGNVRRTTLVPFDQVAAYIRGVGNETAR